MVIDQKDRDQYNAQDGLESTHVLESDDSMEVAASGLCSGSCLEKMLRKCHTR